MGTVIVGNFEWDSAKATTNEAKHGVTFQEAISVFADSGVIFRDDGSGVGRLIATGFSHRARLLSVVHQPGSERDRLISARIATPNESALYGENLR